MVTKILFYSYINTSVIIFLFYYCYYELKNKKEEKKFKPHLNIKRNKADSGKKDNYLHEKRAPVPTPPQIDENYSDRNDDLPFSTPLTTPKRCIKEMKMLERTYQKVDIESCEKKSRLLTGKVVI